MPCGAQTHEVGLVIPCVPGDKEEEDTIREWKKVDMSITFRMPTKEIIDRYTLITMFEILGVSFADNGLRMTFQRDMNEGDEMEWGDYACERTTKDFATRGASPKKTKWCEAKTRGRKIGDGGSRDHWLDDGAVAKEIACIDDQWVPAPARRPSLGMCTGLNEPEQWLR